MAENTGEKLANCVTLGEKAEVVAGQVCRRSVFYMSTASKITDTNNVLHGTKSHVMLAANLRNVCS